MAKCWLWKQIWIPLIILITYCVTFSNKVVRPLDKVATPLMPQLSHSLMEHLVRNNYMSDTLIGIENTKKEKKV